MKPWPTIACLLGALLYADAAAIESAPATTPATNSAHWAFQPVRPPRIPSVRPSEACRNDLDRLLLADWEKKGLQPAPPADRRTLIRRASFDLTGLPPSFEDIEAFVSDPAPDAWEKLVDRLLDSPHYGEHWGRHWLDVVRYADTAGETADYPVVESWRYRNYVIDAFNTDKPYDEFLREQIAGDILARRGPRDRYAERTVATGYLAISRRFGFDSENYHHLTLQDTIDTLGQSVLGLTLGCARCHAHKYDPVSMRDYYALYGIFDSTRYAFPGSEQKQRLRAMVPLEPPAESRPKWRAFEHRVAHLGRDLERRKQSVPASTLRSLDELDGDFELQAPAAGGSKGVLVPPWTYEGPIAVTTEAQSPFRQWHPLGKVGASLPAGTNLCRLAQALHPVRTRRDGGRLHLNLDFRVATDSPAARGRNRFWIGGRESSPAVEVALSADLVLLRLDHAWTTVARLAPGQWHALQLTLDLDNGTVSGRLARPGERTLLTERPLSASWNGTIDFLAFEGDPTGDPHRPAITLDNFAVEETPIPPPSTESPPADAAIAEVVDPKRELETLLAEGPVALAYAVSEGTPRDARIQRRGEPDQPGEEVPRGFLEVLGGGTLRDGRNSSGRLELAEWLTRPDHPLTARVMVNRIWQHHFGRGLVPTPNDFGTRGQPPTHPEVLDYLATQFVRGGWSIKTIHRLIMSSAVYRQRSQYSVDPWSVDQPSANPAESNACPALPTTSPLSTSPLSTSPLSTASLPTASLPTASLPTASLPTASLTPFPRRRLAAEEIRDSILRVSGTLDVAPGRAHPFPAPTGWGYTQHAPFGAVYDHSHRSVYLMTQRIRRHPFLALFDGADPNASTAERRTTTVPTQALFFLNAPFVHANAARFAERMAEAGPTEADRIDAAYRRALGRNPTDDERLEAASFLAAYRSELAATGTDAGPETGTATATAMGPTNPPIDGAWSALARVLFASNEFLTVD